MVTGAFVFVLSCYHEAADRIEVGVLDGGMGDFQITHQAPFTDHPLQSQDHFIHLQGFHQEVNGAHLYDGVVTKTLDVAGHHHHVYGYLFFQALQKCQAPHARHVDVGED